MRKWLFSLLLLFIVPLFANEQVIILIGPPGAGKGTFSQHLKHNHGYNHISAGDLVRNEITKKTPIGLEIEEIVKKGNYIPKETMHSLIEAAILQFAAEKKPFIIDGFPRTEDSHHFLYDLLKRLNLVDSTMAVLIEANDTVCEERILNRQVCIDCNQVYNAVTAPSKLQNECDFCHGALNTRINDTPEVIKKRIKEYREKISNLQETIFQTYKYQIFYANQPVKECLEKHSQLAESLK